MIERLAETIGLTRWQTQLIVTGGVVLLLAVVRWLVLALVHRRIADSAVWYRTRKLLSYIITIVGAIVLASVWLEGSGLATYVGFLTAGIAIALSDVLKNLAGWAFIVLRRPFRLGDRIEVGGHRGDVVDMRAFRFTLLEVGNRVDAEQSTGRLLHIPNGTVFTEVLANFTTGFQFLWHEIPVLVTFESDWEEAERLVLDALVEHAPDVDDAAVRRELREAATEYQIRFTHLAPTVYLTVRDSGVLLTGRLLVPVRELRSVEEAVWKHLLRGIAATDTVALAYPTVRTTFEGPIRLERG
ncbi:MAG: mechanosensitive ion channel family protein [Actinobacteria bacterium]|nr:mechanosensitive ion channel family protein [Actinomycetota bacterium]